MLQPLQSQRVAASGRRSAPCNRRQMAACPHAHPPLPVLPSLVLLQSRGLFALLSLETLSAETLVFSLAAVEGHVAQTCAACPNNAAQGAPADAVAMHQQHQRQQPSPLVYSPEFNAYLERCLELAATRPDLGPAPAVLLLQVRQGWAGLVYWRVQSEWDAMGWRRPARPDAAPAPAVLVVPASVGSGPR